jgi:class 3 adenylate cyclase
MDKVKMSRTWFYRLLAFAAQLASIACVITALLTLLPFVEKYFVQSKWYDYVVMGMNFETKLEAGLKSYIPTEFNGHDLARFIILVLALFLSGVFSDLNQRYRYKVTYARLKDEMDTLAKAKIVSGGAQDKVALFEQKMQQIHTANRGDRDQLLKEMVEIKRELDKFGRDLAFLSIDVVDSTKMKEHEDAMMCEYDFAQYRQFVENKLMKNGSIKWSWTGDGLMACFNVVGSAIQAAKEIIEDLKIINESKNIKMDFQIRCGINAGYVYFDETKPLEQITDRVLDIAGHMQKHAEPNTVWIAKNVVEPVENVQGFNPANKLIDGYEAYEWKK